jgi:hypothetical protein
MILAIRDRVWINLIECSFCTNQCHCLLYNAILFLNIAGIATTGIDPAVNYKQSARAGEQPNNSLIDWPTLAPRPGSFGVTRMILSSLVYFDRAGRSFR